MSKKVVLITGSSRGLGKDLALVFSENAYDVILHGRDEKSLAETAKEIGKKAGITVINGDLRNNKTLLRLYERAKEKDVSVLINNAGIPCPGLALEKLSYEQIEEILLVNLVIPIRLSKMIYEFFLEKGSGSIINLNSLIALENKQFRAVASASKWGLRGFTNTLRLEAEKNNIKVMGVYISRTITKPEYGWGMESRYVAEEIFKNWRDKNIAELIIDGRPLEARKEIEPKRLIIDGRHKSK